MWSWESLGREGKVSCDVLGVFGRRLDGMGRTS
jgi:hypothetical protein